MIKKLDSYRPFIKEGNICIPWMMEHSWSLYNWGAWSDHEAAMFDSDLQGCGIDKIGCLCDDYEYIDIPKGLVLNVSDGIVDIPAKNFLQLFKKLVQNLFVSEYTLFSYDLKILIFCSSPCDVIAIGTYGYRLENLLSTLKAEHDSQ
jgi:hypothetical protein